MLACSLLPSHGIHCINEKVTLCNTVSILSIDHHVPVMEVANVGNTMWHENFEFYVLFLRYGFESYVLFLCGWFDNYTDCFAKDLCETM